MAVANMDFDSFFRNKVESLLLTASWVEHVQHLLGLKAVSQVWGDKPEWYIWLDHAPGAYALVLEDAESFELQSTSFLMGHFAVKCYPYGDNSILAAFSPQEQELAASDLFDETHTPRLEARERIPESFYNVGSISLILDDAETTSLLAVDSLDALKLWVQSPSENRMRLPGNTEIGCIIRNVPGWQISYPFFDRLVCLFSFYFRHSPIFIGATRSPGFEYFVNSEKHLECKPCAASNHLTASLLFHKSSGPENPVETLWRRQLGPEESIVFMRHLPSAFSDQLVLDSPRVVPINPLWWELADTEMKSEMASTCGCCDHSHGSCSGIR